MNKLIKSIYLSGVIFCILSSSLVNAQTLQRFFMSEQQRSNLDHGIEIDRDISVIASTPQTPQAVNTPPVSSLQNETINVVLTGLVLRQNLQHTIWLNGHAFTPSELPSDITIDYERTRLHNGNRQNRSAQSIEIGENFNISDQQYIQIYGDMLRPIQQAIIAIEGVNTTALSQEED